MEHQIKIEKGIPVPLIPCRKNMYPFHNMKEIGDSFAVPINIKTDPKRIVSSIRSSFMRFTKTNKLKWKCIIAITEDRKVRCWRTE